MRILFAFLAIATSSVLQAAPATYRIDPEHFSIAFLVNHVGYAKVIGQFAKAQGQFVYDERAKSLQSGRIEIRSDSASTHHEKRDAHVLGRDFLNAKAYPLVVFEAKHYRIDAPSAGTLTGELTLLGQTHPIELKVTLNKAAVYPFGHREDTLGVSATTTIQRSRWGMTYGVKNGLVGDEVQLLFEFEAQRNAKTSSSR